MRLLMFPLLLVLAACGTTSPPAESYTVFFAPEAVTLNALGQTVVERAARDGKRIGATRIDVLGYTDQVGDRSANLALSVKRAAAVKAMLVDRGLPGETIRAQGAGEFGESDIATDGRHVEIRLYK